MANEDSKAKFEWSVYYKGKEGYAENLRVTADSSDALQEGRSGLVLWLQAAEAVPQPRDREPVAPRAPQAASGGAPKPAAAGGTPGVAATCPECGSPMRYKEGGIVKNPNSAKFGQQYGAFYSCSAFPNCRGRMNA